MFCLKSKQTDVRTGAGGSKVQFETAIPTIPASWSSIFERVVSGISWPWDGCPKPRQQLMRSWGGVYLPRCGCSPFVRLALGDPPPPRRQQQPISERGGYTPPVGSTVFGGGIPPPWVSWGHGGQYFSNYSKVGKNPQAPSKVGNMFWERT